MKFHRAEMASLRADLQDKDRTLGRFTSELRKVSWWDRWPTQRYTRTYFYSRECSCEL